VLDRDRTSQDDFLGYCEIPIDGELLSGAVVDRWYALQPKAYSTSSTGGSSTSSYTAQPASAVHSTAANMAAQCTASSTPTATAAALHKTVSAPAGLHTRSATIATAGAEHDQHSSSAPQSAHLPPRRSLSAPWRRGSVTPVRRASDPAETVAIKRDSPTNDHSLQQHRGAHKQSMPSVLHRKLSLPTRRSSSSTSTTATHSPGSAVSSVSDLGYAATADTSSHSLDASTAACATAGAAAGEQCATAMQVEAAASPLPVQLPPSGTALGHVRIRLWYQFNETSHLVR
jgi:hypothetical protein